MVMTLELLVCVFFLKLCLCDDVNWSRGNFFEGNLGSLLLVIIPSICREKGSPFGEQDICHKHGLAYVSLSIAVCP